MGASLRTKRFFDPLRRPEVSLIAFSAATIVIVVSLFTMDMVWQYRATVAAARDSTLTYASILAEHTERTFEAASRTLREAELIRADALAGKFKSEHELKEALQHLQRTSSILVALGWTDETGALIAHSYAGDPPRPSLGEMPHFKAQRAAADGAFFLSPPFVSVSGGRWLSAVSRRLSKPNGDFDGIVSAPIDPTYFTDIYRSLGLGAHGTVVLSYRPSHTVLAREPYLESVIGRSYPARAERLERLLLSSDSGTYEVPSILDGRDLLVGFKAVNGLPLVVIVAQTRAEVLGPWREQLLCVGAILFALIGVIIAGTIYLVRKERALAEQSSLLSSTLNNMDQGLITVAADGTIPIYNRRALEMLDLPLELMSKRPRAREVMSYMRDNGEFDGVAEGVRPLLLAKLEDEKGYTYERVRPDGTVLEVRTAPFSEGVVVRTYTDVSASHAVEAALRLEKERAEAASRAKGEFVANISHELRTPLTAIIGVSELLLRADRSPSEVKRFLTIQRDAGNGLLGIINDILDFSKIEAGQIKLNAADFELAVFVNGVAALLAGEAEQKALTLAVSTDAALPEWLTGDETRLRQVLLNLLSNAVKFTAQGSVTLRALPPAVAGMTIRFEICDTGIGIESYRLVSIFERFTQGDSSTTRRYGGTGLGLAISRGLVEKMRGVIGVKSDPGQGSTFWFELPLAAASRQLVSAATAPLRSVTASHRLLLAEDSATNRELIAAVLIESGHSVDMVVNGADAITACERDSFDAILMDVQMPELDGYEATRQLRVRGITTPVVGLTAHVGQEERDRCIASGMDAYFCKPVEWQQLLAGLDALIAASRSSSGTAPLDENPLENATFQALQGKIGIAAVASLLRLFEQEVVVFMDALLSNGVSHTDLASDAHRLAGSASLLGLQRVAEACRVVESAVQDDPASTRERRRCHASLDRALVAVRSSMARTAGFPATPVDTQAHPSPAFRRA